MAKPKYVPRKVDTRRILMAFARAYALGHLSTTTPKLLQIIAGLLKKRLGPTDAAKQLVQAILRQSSPNRFPTFCAVVVGGSLLFQRTIVQALRIPYETTVLRNATTSAGLERLSKFLSAFLASFIGIWLLNRKTFTHADLQSQKGDKVVFPLERPRIQHPRRRSSVRLSPDFNVSEVQVAEGARPLTETRFAGRTMTLTSFALVRALDLVVASLWDSHKSRTRDSQAWKRVNAFTANSSYPLAFALSAYVVMWSWFYTPDRLPRAYNHWISSAAQIDGRLVQALREARYGEFIYGKDTGLAPLLQSMCRDYHMPIEWGDPNVTIPVPCELYHSGAGPSCEWHAAQRFARAWKFAMGMYLPLNLILLWRQDFSARSVTRATLDANRSSAFLGGFVGLFYYAVCCARTRLGPKIFDANTVTSQMWDSGLCTGAGCAASGWSILLEKASKRHEMVYFVAPRAIATMLPQLYDIKCLWREELTFATSAAVVITAAQENPRRVRGVLGRVLQQLLQ